MEFNEENLNKLIAEVSEFNDITLSDIPDMYLYMDQVTTLFDNKLNPLKRDEHDKIMTSTMINNYAKAKIFPSVKNKKYNKQQIIFLDLIYNLKQSLSLTDIDLLLKPISEDIKNDEKSLPSVENLYTTFLDMKKDQLNEFDKRFNEMQNAIREKSNNLEGSDKNLKELILLVFMLISQANIEKRMAEKILDNFFKAAVVKEHS